MHGNCKWTKELCSIESKRFNTKSEWKHYANVVEELGSPRSTRTLSTYSADGNMGTATWIRRDIFIEAMIPYGMEEHNWME